MLLCRAFRFFRSLRSFPPSTAAFNKPIAISSSIYSNSVSTRRSRYYSTEIKSDMDYRFKVMLFGSIALVLGIDSSPLVADDGSVSEVALDNNKEEAFVTGLRKIEDGSVVSNTHTVKWRLFTDNGRSLCLQAKLDEAEKYFILALQEAKEGFGERDAHVASSCNNLAELYRVKKLFEKAEPLYLDAIKILEESFGSEDVRVGAALHNLGQFYLVQRKLDEAKKCYERALKIKGRVLGYGHTDYADTMYHLGTVLHLLKKDKDSMALIQDSIRILEEGGLGESVTCIRRMKYLSQILLQSDKLYEVENLQRKILHILEISKGWDSVDTVVAAESLAMTLQSLGNLVEAREVMERCLRSKENILSKNHIQVAASKLQLARIFMLSSSSLRKVNLSEAAIELDKAKSMLDDSIRISRLTLDHQNDDEKNLLAKRTSGDSVKDEHRAFIILLQALDAIGLVEVARLELRSKDTGALPIDSELALRECLSFFNEPKFQSMINSPDVRKEYVSCLRHLLNIARDHSSGETQSSGAVFQELKDKVKHIEDELMTSSKNIS